MKNLLNSLHFLVKRHFDWSYEDSERYFFTYGITAFVGTFIFYFINLFLVEATFSRLHDVVLRVPSLILLTPLILDRFNVGKIVFQYINKKTWWYVTLFYTLPFFFTVSLLANIHSPVWQMNGLIACFVLALFTDWVCFICMFIGGSMMAVLYCYLAESYLLPNILHLPEVYINYLGPVVYVMLFSRKKKQIQEEKLNAMRTVANYVAHELRTPISTMGLTATVIARTMPKYQEGYEKAQEAGLIEQKFSPFEQTQLAGLCANLPAICENAHTVINALLCNLKNEFEEDQSVVDAKEAIEETLLHYPMLNEKQRAIGLELEDNFTFLGNKELFKHVISNLLKNAIDATRKKDQINIQLKKAYHYNEVVISDSGKGIDEKELPYIFEPFYSKKSLGTGLGLAFCKTVIARWGGIMLCHSKPSQYTTFVIQLPKR